MKTMTRPAAEMDRSVAGYDLPPHAERPTGTDRSGRSSQVSLSRQSLIAVVWSVFPAVLGGAVESLSLGRPCLAVLAVVAHQLAILLLAGRRDGRSARWGANEWTLLAAGAAATIAFADVALLPWLLLPVGPAVLLRAAGREGLLPRPAGLMRVFSVATLGAVLVQLAATVPTAGVAVAVLGGTVLFLAGVERLAGSE